MVLLRPFSLKVDVIFSNSRSSTPNSGLSPPISFDHGQQMSLSEIEIPETSNFFDDLTVLDDSLKETLQSMGFFNIDDFDKPFQLK